MNLQSGSLDLLDEQSKASKKQQRYFSELFANCGPLQKLKKAACTMATRQIKASCIYISSKQVKSVCIAEITEKRYTYSFEKVGNKHGNPCRPGKMQHQTTSKSLEWRECNNKEIKLTSKQSTYEEMSWDQIVIFAKKKVATYYGYKIPNFLQAAVFRRYSLLNTKDHMP